MKLPTILKRDSAGALATARAKLAEIEAKLVDLATSRSAALVDSDDDGVVIQIDGQIAAASRTKPFSKIESPRSRWSFVSNKPKRPSGSTRLESLL
jgi:hypothetical protein